MGQRHPRPWEICSPERDECKARGTGMEKVFFLPFPFHLCHKEKPPLLCIFIGAVINEGPSLSPR